MLESRKLGWWDIAAYVMKLCKLPSIMLGEETYMLGPALQDSIRRILALFKTLPAGQTEGLLSRLSDVCGVPIPPTDVQSAQLMTWDQVRALRRTGHAIGSHSLSHRVLATLEPGAQSNEITESRQLLQQATGGEIRSFAYPVGGPQHFNDHSVRCARIAGYSQAFSFNTGIASFPVEDPFRIPRESAKSLELLKAKVMLPGLMGLGKRNAV